MVDKNENELIKEFLRGNEIAFNELVRTHQKTIYWHARRMVGNHFDADEVTQQVIIVLFKKLKNFKFESSLSTWIYKITQSRSLNLLRQKKVKRFFNMDDSILQKLGAKEDILTNFEDKERIGKVQKLLEQLPIKQKEVFVFRQFEQLSYKEISEITGTSIGGLKANYFHAAKRIMEMMNDE
ncbi:MAG: RNA polymerase sigma factor [Melioribacteraceae bacterium]